MSEWSLHPRRWNAFVLVLFPAVAILQWVLVVPLAIDAQVWDSIDRYVPEGVENTHAFSEDFFYLGWNLLPVLLFAIYLTTFRLWRGLSSKILDCFDREEALARLSRVNRVRDHLVPVLTFAVIALLGTIAQIFKQQGFIETGEHMYWWDWRISKPIFLVRILAIPTNMFLVLFVLWRTVLAFVGLIAMARGATLRPRVFHPDGICGFKPYGAALFLLILPLVLGAFVGVLGAFDHRGDDSALLLNKLADAGMVLGCTGAATVLFYLASRSVHSRLRDRVGGVLERMEELADPSGLSAALDGDSSGDNSALRERAAVLPTYHWVARVGTWPFSPGQLLRSVAAVASPIAALLKVIA